MLGHAAVTVLPFAPTCKGDCYYILLQEKSKQKGSVNLPKAGRLSIFMQ
jgi:hypothetical protein